MKLIVSLLLSAAALCAQGQWFHAVYTGNDWTGPYDLTLNMAAVEAHHWCGELDVCQGLSGVVNTSGNFYLLVPEDYKRFVREFAAYQQQMGVIPASGPTIPPDPWARLQRAAFSDEPAKVKALVSVTYNVLQDKFRWDAAEVHQESGEWVIDRMLEQSEIDPDEATMRVGDEVRRFDEQEAAQLHKILTILAKYAIESSAWWEDGKGKPVNQPAALRAKR